MEQVLTDKQFELLLNVLEEGDKSYTSSAYRDMIMTAHTDLFWELGVQDIATMEFGQSEFLVVANQFRSATLDIYTKYQAGTLPIGQATAEFRTLLKQYGKNAFLAGTKMVGNPYYSKIGATQKDLAFINKYARAESRYFHRFLYDIKDPKHLPVGKIPVNAQGRRLPGYRAQVHPYTQRLDYYAQSLRGMGFNGMVAGAGTLVNVYWRLDKFAGRKADHCLDCENIQSGNPYSWQTLPTIPRGGDTRCLYRCYCGLEFQGPPKGRTLDIPGSASTRGLLAPCRWAKIYDKKGMEIKGTPLDDIEEIYRRMNKARQMIEITQGAEKARWIKFRQAQNKGLVEYFPQYKIRPMVAVKDLIATIKTAQPATGFPIKTLQGMPAGAIEVVFVRGNYSAPGKIFIKAGKVIFKDATGIELTVNLDSDIIWALRKAGVIIPEAIIAEAQGKCLMVLRGEGKEYGIALDNSGNVMIEKKGTAHSINYTNAEIMVQRRGAFHIHGHPSGGSFSDNDIMFASQQQFGKIQVVGEKYLYEIRPKAGKGWPSPQIIRSTYSRIRFVEELKFRQACARKVNLRMTPAQMVRLHDEEWMRATHNMIKELSTLFDLEYTRTARIW